MASLKERLRGNEFLRHLLTLMSGTAVAQILPIAASPIITRLYSPAEMGVYTLFMAFVTGLLTIATWRYDLAIVLPKRVEDARALVKLSNRLSAITCLVLGLGLFIASGPITEAMGTPELKPWLAFAGVVAWAYSQVSIFNYWCNRNKYYKLMSVNRIGQSVTTTGTQLGFGAASLGTAGLVISTFLGQLIAAGNLFRKTRHEIYGQPTSSMRAMMSEHKKLPLMNAPTAVLDAVRLQGTQLLIGTFFTTAAVGQFGQAWKLLQTPAGLINSSLTQVFFQKMAVTKRGDMSRVVRNGIVRSALVGIVPFVLIYLLSPPLFPIIFGERWALAGQIGAALVPWLYLNFITSPISMLFIVTKRQGTVFWFGLPFTAAPLALLWFLHDDVLTTVMWLSWLMAGLLVIYLVLALWVARGYDKGEEHLHAEELTIEEADLETEAADDVVDKPEGA
ncbi:MAG TPA: oligosaccharide flippase family protein [Tessaracoccus flavescens]|uniref:Oligosaccharide flippase family protein n=1 Tax=Tessaracoccus flavescens TaxID=399497 RepID=A0A921EQ97_9ACTN|nr:oligosaccharide flippase family protein [Tessaracoccus flavescens]